MKTPSCMVYVVEDEEAVSSGFESLLRSMQIPVQCFRSAPEFLAATRLEVPSCLILDVRLPGMSGLELQRQLSQANVRLPIIFTTGFGDVPMSVQAMKLGAIEFLIKPVRGQDLLDAVQQALAQDRATRDDRQQAAELIARFSRLSPREREVLDLIVEGLLNKQVADRLNVSELTVKTHRAHIMEKTGAESLAALARIYERVSLSDDAPPAKEG